MAFAARLHDLTADEYFALADRLPPNAQLIDGEVIVNTPTFGHQHMAGSLYVRLRLWTQESSGCGMCGIPVDVKIDDRNVYAPDVWWCREGRQPRIEDARLPDVPDLAVEVLSPSTRRYDVGVKCRRYEERGVPEVWIIDPKRLTATILRRSTSSVATFDVELALGVDDELASPQLPGFVARIGDLIL